VFSHIFAYVAAGPNIGFFIQLLVWLFVIVNQSQSQHAINLENELFAKLLISQLSILVTLDKQNYCISALKSTEVLIVTSHYSDQPRVLVLRVFDY
jgi:hypothetical protein